MEDNIIIEDIEFKEELYRKNIEKEEIKKILFSFLNSQKFIFE